MKVKLVMGVLGCILLCACSIADPDTPNYDSSKKEQLPDIVIKSVDSIFLRQVSVKVNITPNDKRSPRKLYLCYSKDTDLPDTTGLKVNLLPQYTSGTINTKLKNLRPSTLYYSRVYAETRDEEGYSDCVKFRTATSDSDIAWKKVTDFPNKAALYNLAFTIGEEIYFQECELNNHTSLGGTALLKYTTQTGVWQKVTDFPGGRRYDPVVFVIEGEIYMGLGLMTNGEERWIAKSDLWKYNPANNTWQQMEDYPGYPLNVMSNFVYKGKGYLVSTPALWDEYPMYVMVFDPVTNKWTKKKDFPGKKVNRALTLTAEGRIFAVCGSFPFINEASFSDCLWEYIPDTDTWFRRANFPGTERNEAQGFVIGNRLYAGFGYENRIGNSVEYVNDLWEYIPAQDTWMSRASMTKWLPLFSVSAGTQHGGYLGSAEYGLWMYSPENDK